MVDVLNKYRVFPRIFAIFYMVWMAIVMDWAMIQPDLSTGQAGFVSSVVLAAAAFFKFYTETGGD